MKVTVSGHNLKVFVKGAHAINKLGPELHFLCTQNQFSIKNVNVCKSAFATLQYNASFFETFSVNTPCRFQLSTKAFFSVFRLLSHFDKNVQRCLLHMEESDNQLIIQLHCKNDILKTYLLDVKDCEHLQPIFCKESCSHHFIIDSKTFSDALQNFSVSQGEILLLMHPDGCELRNYYPSSTPLGKRVSSSLQLSPGEFQYFDVSDEGGSIVFALKEMKTALYFGESLGLASHVYFSEFGKPLGLEVEDAQRRDFQLFFVLATLPVAEAPQSTQQPSLVGPPPSFNTSATSDHVAWASSHVAVERSPIPRGSAPSSQLATSSRVPGPRPSPSPLPDQPPPVSSANPMRRGPTPSLILGTSQVSSVHSSRVAGPRPPHSSHTGQPPTVSPAIPVSLRSHRAAAASQILAMETQLPPESSAPMTPSILMSHRPNVTAIVEETRLGPHMSSPCSSIHHESYNTHCQDSLLMTQRETENEATVIVVHDASQPERPTALPRPGAPPLKRAFLVPQNMTQSTQRTQRISNLFAELDEEGEATQWQNSQAKSTQLPFAQYTKNSNVPFVESSFVSATLSQLQPIVVSGSDETQRTVFVPDSDEEA